jgi:2'-5' RNA ligase
MSLRLRLFAGIELDEKTRSACAAIGARLAACGLQARFEAPEKLHITLAFLGWVDPEQVEPIHDALQSIARSSPPFSITFDTIGAFPHERRPRIIWAGAQKQSPAFITLSRTAREIYGALGFSFEKDALMHVTLARVKGGNAHLPMLDLAPARMNVDHIALFESLPAGGTTRYEIRTRAALKTRV